MENLVPSIQEVSKKVNSWNGRFFGISAVSTLRVILVMVVHGAKLIGIMPQEIKRLAVV